jgi:hypothetical protein
MSHRQILRIVGVAALAAAIGCSTSPPPPSQNGEPGSQVGTLQAPTKNLPKGATVGQGKAVID